MRKSSILAAGVLAATLAACGSDDSATNSAGRRRRVRRRATDDLLVAAAAGRGARAVRGGGQRRQARARAGGRQGRQVPDQVRLARRLDRAGGGLGAERDVHQRAQGGRRQVDDRLHRRVQLRRHRGLAADPQRGRHRAGQPGQHRGRHHVRRPRRDRPASPTSTTRPACAPTPASCPRTPTRAPRWRRWPRRRTAPRPTSSTTRRSTARAWPRTSSSSAKKVGLEIKGNEGIDKNAANYRSLASKIKATGAQCFIYAGITANNAVQIFKDMAAALPDAPLLGPEGVGESGFFDPKDGGLPADVAKRVLVTIPGVAPEEYPPAGKEFLKAYDGEVRREEPGPLRRLRLRVDEPAAGRDQARRRRRQRPRRGGQAAARPPRTARASSASTRSTPTATSRSRRTASTGSRTARSSSTTRSRPPRSAPPRRPARGSHVAAIREQLEVGDRLGRRQHAVEQVHVGERALAARPGEAGGDLVRRSADRRPARRRRRRAACRGARAARRRAR